MTVTQMATHTNSKKYQVVRYLRELEIKNVISKDKNGVIFSRRMIREAEKFTTFHASDHAPNVAPDHATNTATKNLGKPPKAEFGLARAYKYNKYNIIYNYNNNSKLEKKEIEKKKKKTSNPSPRSTRLPENWQPSEELRQYAIKLGLDPDLTAQKFRNYYTRLPDSDSRAFKSVWDIAFVNWCLRAVEFGEGKNKKPKSTPENVVPFPPNNPRKPSNLDWMIAEHNDKYGAN